MSTNEERLRAELKLPSRDKIQGGFDVLLQIRSWVKLCRIPTNSGRPSAGEFEGFIANLYSEYERALAALPEASQRHFTNSLGMCCYYSHGNVPHMQNFDCIEWAALPEASPRTEHNWPFEMAQQRVEIVERMMKLPYIKAQRDTEKGQERFVCRDDVITMIHNYAKELRAVPEASEPLPHKRDASGMHHSDDCPRCALDQAAAPLAQQHTHTPEDEEGCCICGWVCNQSVHFPDICAEQYAEHVREVPK